MMARYREGLCMAFASLAGCAAFLLHRCRLGQCLGRKQIIFRPNRPRTVQTDSRRRQNRRLQKICTNKPQRRNIPSSRIGSGARGVGLDLGRYPDLIKRG
ncbi:hypothetical protein B0T25DRAFT_543812 [Lasiosphaeria hispida]|uniref:Uncharacterized protein n=1 Tax=Lasiosphaeria hispida TaxID=260671 RepID=A0AAJ0HI75_9PEZI|nr:hypothetical protein B0T25DRAFT_543812 [Lasiosphaeria hispida]